MADEHNMVLTPPAKSWIFVKFPEAGKSWVVISILESPGNLS